MFNSILTEFEQTYAQDLIVECFGSEAQLYAEDYRITEFLAVRYNRLVRDNLDFIRGKRIADVGSGTGVYSILMCLHGADHVTAIEPRRQLTQGLHRVVDKHRLPIRAVADFHTAALAEPVDTVILSGVLDLIPDTIEYLRQLGTVAEYIIIKNGVSGVDPDSAKIQLGYNIHHRAGFNLDQTIDDGLGLQTTVHNIESSPGCGQFIQYKFGANYLTKIAEYLQYEIVKKTDDEQYRRQYLVLKTKRQIIDE